MDVEVKIVNLDNATSGKNVVTILSLKILNMILAIFAFATTTSVNTMVKFGANCAEDLHRSAETVHVSYPFDLEHHYFTIPLCRLLPNRTSKIAVLQGSKTSSEFYVCVGVLVFLYCMVSVILYIFFDDLYRRSNLWTVLDFVIALFVILLWLVASSAWAQGVVNLKYYTNLEECGVFDSLEDCRLHGCKQSEFPSFASLNVSIIFGYLNVIVWIANLWFLYKETPWVRWRKTNIQTSHLSYPLVDAEPKSGQYV